MTEMPSGVGPAYPVRTEKEIAAELRLRPEPAKVVRLSRKVLGVIVGVSALALGGSLIWALQTKAPRTVDELYNTDSRATAEGLSRLPSDYAGRPRDVPELGPPLPGDLGGPMLEAGVVPDAPIGTSGTTMGATAIDLEAERIEQERQRLAQEIGAARASRLFATEAQANEGSASQTPSARPVGPLTARLAGASEEGAANQPGTNPAISQQGFLDRETGRGAQSSERLQTPSSPYVLQAGSVIAAALLTGLRSDLPGQVTAQVTENVYDNPTGRHLLIPQGSRLIGEYDDEVSFGQSRALLVWTRLILPDGRSISLGREPGADPAGRSGLEDQVDNHWGQLFRAAMLSTLLSVGAEAGSSLDEDDLLQTIRRGLSDSVSQTGRQVVGRSLGVRPTITVRPGFPVRVIVTRDLVLERD